MTIYEALEKDHRVVKALLTELVNLPEGEKSSHKQLIEKIRDELIPHARAEEAVLYNSLREVEGGGDVVAHGYKEHVEAETLLRVLQAAGTIDAGWKTMAKKLKDALEHHIKEEEGEIFKAAKQTFTVEEAQGMGAAFEKLKPEIKEDGIMTTSMQLIANLMPARFVPAFKKFNLESRV